MVQRGTVAVHLQLFGSFILKKIISNDYYVLPQVTMPCNE